MRIPDFEPHLPPPLPPPRPRPDEERDLLLVRRTQAASWRHGVEHLPARAAPTHETGVPRARGAIRTVEHGGEHGLYVLELVRDAQLVFELDGVGGGQGGKRARGAERRFVLGREGAREVFGGPGFFLESVVVLVEAVVFGGLAQLRKENYRLIMACTYVRI